MKKNSIRRGITSDTQNINTIKKKFLDDPVSLKNLSQDFLDIIFSIDFSKA